MVSRAPPPPDGGDATVPHVSSLATLPALSPRAQLVLLLRRLYEARHAGGFERVCPPPHAQLAARYRAIAEYVPPSLKETAVYARRRQEALALRAGKDAPPRAPGTMGSSSRGVL